MKIYKDQNLNYEISNIDLGRVEVNQTKEYSYYLYNNSTGNLESISIKLDDVPDSSEVKIIEFPEKLKAKEKALFKFSWTPSLNLERGLKTRISINAVEVWG